MHTRVYYRSYYNSYYNSYYHRRLTGLGGEKGHEEEKETTHL